MKAKIIPQAEDGKMKYKTETHRKNLNPEFNETFVIDIKPGDKVKRLLIEVMQKHLSSAGDRPSHSPLDPALLAIIPPLSRYPRKYRFP